jgi:hypothetical protein
MKVSGAARRTLRKFIGVVQRGGRKMPRYYYALNDDLPVENAAEELPDDKAARELADLIEQELDRCGARRPFRIVVYNDRRERISRQT